MSNHTSKLRLAQGKKGLRWFLPARVTEIDF